MRPFFEHLKKNYHEELVGVEVGVSVGNNANNILCGLPNIKMLHLVDPYFPYYSFRSEKGQIANKNKAIDVLTPFAHKISFIYHTSEIAVETIGEESIDFVYIDGDHTEYGIENDIKFWFPKVRSGGIIGGHDFESSEDNYAISKVVSKFVMEQCKSVLTVNDSDWWVTK